MTTPWSQTSAILWAQARTLRNLYPRAKPSGVAFSVLGGIVWYGLWIFIAMTLAWALGRPDGHRTLPVRLPSGLLLVVLYWQLVPLVLVTAGLSLDLRRLRVYPIPDSHLFWIEVILRMSTGVEMLILMVGAALGFAGNAFLPWWSGVALVPFALFNLLLATGVKDLFTRALARKRLRELVILFCVSLGAVPQFLSIFGVPAWLRDLFRFTASVWSPWGATSQLILGPHAGWAMFSLGAWITAVFFFARWQFHRSLFFDPDSTRAADRTRSKRALAWLESVYRLPRSLFSDPLAALVEKELRFLSRAPRFRLVFFMGFTFGMILWLPIALGRGGRGMWEAPASDGLLSGNFFTIICLYAMTLLGEVAFWNNLGFDRAAGQMYFLAPVPFSQVLLAKNLAAVFFVLLEVFAVSLVVLVLRLPVGWTKFPEAIAVAIVFAVYLLAVGNVGSVLYPRPVDPAQSWRTSTGSRFQALLLIVYPLAAMPILLAFLIRRASQSEAAFYAALGAGLVLALVLYRFSMRYAVRTAEEKREEIASILSASQAPIG